MTATPLRWEWRVFDGDLSPAVAKLSSLQPVDHQTSDEVYLISPHSTASVKIRGGRLDAKRLQQRADSGLELWRPVLPARFLLPAATVVQVLELLHVPVSALTHATYARKEFQDEILTPELSLRAVRVHKTRTHFRLDACWAELAEISAGGRSARTVCLESEDPHIVMAAVSELGLGGDPNQSYPQFLKALIGMTGSVA